MADMSNKERKRLQKREYHSGKRRIGSGNIASVKKRKGKTSSSTSGVSKGIVASPLQRSMCRRNRSYKHPQYDAVMSTMGVRGQNSQGS